MKKTLVLGASIHQFRYSNRAIKKLQKFGFEVVGIGISKGHIQDCTIHTEPVDLENIHTVSVYLNAGNQESYLDYVVSLNPQRVIFNPGSENPKFEALLRKHQIFYERACTLILLQTGQY